MIALTDYIGQCLSRLDVLNPPKEATSSLRFDSRDYQLVFDPSNERIKLYGLTASIIKKNCDAPDADHKWPFSKIICYAPIGDNDLWHKLGFIKEGIIPGFFNNHIPSVIWSCFLNATRRYNSKKSEQNKLVALAESKSQPGINPGSATSAIHTAGPDDAAMLSPFLKSIFTDYPSSLDMETLQKNIKNGHSLFKYILNERNEIIACASAEIDVVRRSAELTDCATNPDYRGKGLMAAILNALENDLKTGFSVIDCYTLCRADIAGINMAFAKIGYQYHGRLVNNCRMPGGWESMNIWAKQL